MAIWTHKDERLSNLPLRIQAQKIKNEGNTNLYVMDIEEDLLIPDSSLLRYSKAIVFPGQELDLTSHHLFKHCVSAPDFDITIHSNANITLSITSDDICTRWELKNSHPWMGGMLPNGTYTKKYEQIIALPTFMGSAPYWPDGETPYKELSYSKDKCTCTIKHLMENGCSCGHIQRGKWGLRE